MSELTPQLRCSSKNFLRSFLFVGIIILAAAQQSLFAQATQTREEVIEGTVEILHEDRHDGSRYIHFLHTAVGRLELRFADRLPNLMSGDRIRVNGRMSQGVLGRLHPTAFSISLLA